MVKSFVFTWRLCDPVVKVRTLWWLAGVLISFPESICDKL